MGIDEILEMGVPS